MEGKIGPNKEGIIGWKGAANPTHYLDNKRYLLLMLELQFVFNFCRLLENGLIAFIQFFLE